jgi:hypothetical protein
MNNQEARAKEFLSCLGNGKTIYECEAENDCIDDFYGYRDEPKLNKCLEKKKTKK